MNLNSRFKPQIESYLKEISKNNPNGTVFSIILQNAIIIYNDAPIEDIKWYYFC